MSLPRKTNLCLVISAAVFSLLSAASPVHGGFHFWQVKEVFTTADGSVQFIEMFDSFTNENFVAGSTLRSNSDGVTKDFVFPSSLGGDTAGKHMLIAMPGFGSLPGAVTPTYTFDQGGVVGSFFNPSATNITITFLGSGDAMAFTGASLPKDGINSLTDSGAFGFPPGTPNISSGINSPTNYNGSSGSVNLSTPSPTGDYNGNHSVDAADYIVWRNTLTQTASPAGSGADGNSSGAIEAGDLTFWRSKFGNAAGSGIGLTAAPEPAAGAMFLLAALMARIVRRRR